VDLQQPEARWFQPPITHVEALRTVDHDLASRAFDLERAGHGARLAPEGDLTVDGSVGLDGCDVASNRGVALRVDPAPRFAVDQRVSGAEPIHVDLDRAGDDGFVVDLGPAAQPRRGRVHRMDRRRPFDPHLGAVGHDLVPGHAPSVRPPELSSPIRADRADRENFVRGRSWSLSST